MSGSLRVFPILVTLAATMLIVVAVSGARSRSAPAVEVRPICCADRGDAYSLEAAVEHAEVILVVRTERRVGQEWPDVEMVTRTLYDVRVEDVIKGDGHVRAGDSVRVIASGGYVRHIARDVFRRPRPGDRVVLEEDMTAPHYVIGRRELVLLRSAGRRQADYGFGTRFDANNPERVKILAAQGGFDDPLAIPGSDDWRAELVGIPLAVARARIVELLD